VYTALVKETFDLDGVLPSSKLTVAYPEKMIQLRDKEIESLRSKKNSVAFNDTEHGKCSFLFPMYRRHIKVLCINQRASFFHIENHRYSQVYGFNDSNRPMIDLVFFQNYRFVFAAYKV
jgi:hypothetical protein